MNATPARGGLIGTLLSAAIGVLALVVCLAVIVLTDDDFDTGTPAGVNGGDDAGSSDGARTQAAPGASGPAVPKSCTPLKCPGTEEPDVEAGEFPFPPGAADPVWNQDSCAGNVSSGTTIRAIRLRVDDVRDWYLANLPAAGYGWGVATGVDANPFREKDDGTSVPLGWGAALSTEDHSYAGQLDLETGHERATVCGPAPGETYIEVRLQ